MHLRESIYLKNSGFSLKEIRLKMLEEDFSDSGCIYALKKLCLVN
jgi:hypothetical protein